MLTTEISPDQNKILLGFYKKANYSVKGIALVDYEVKGEKIVLSIETADCNEPTVASIPIALLWELINETGDNAGHEDHHNWTLLNIEDSVPKKLSPEKWFWDCSSHRDRFTYVEMLMKRVLHQSVKQLKTI